MLKSVMLVVAVVLILLTAIVLAVVAARGFISWLGQRHGRFKPLYVREWRDVPLVEKKR